MAKGFKTGGRKKGLGHSIEVKKKISEAKKGKPAHNKGKKAPWTTKRNIETNYLRSGNKHWNWKGGQTKESRSWQKNRRNRLKQILNNQGLGHTFGEWELLKKQYNYTCPCCSKSEPEVKLTEDHIIPLSKGGSDFIENIQPLCLKCNIKKHTKIIKY
jgi:5-methylcytosine-specific restriction endonuclease McrA